MFFFHLLIVKDENWKQKNFSMHLRCYVFVPIRMAVTLTKPELIPMTILKKLTRCRWPQGHKKVKTIQIGPLELDLWFYLKHNLIQRSIFNRNYYYTSTLGLRNLPIRNKQFFCSRAQGFYLGQVFLFLCHHLDPIICLCNPITHINKTG